MTTDPALQWFYDYFDDVDTMQIDKMAARLADDVVVRFGNDPIVRGKPAAVAAIAGLWENFKSLRHTHGQVVSNGDYASGEGAVTFTLHDDRTITIPGITILERRNGLVTRLSGYLDFAPLYAPPGAAITVTEPVFFVTSGR